MNKIRIALSVLAIVFATFAAYSFTRVPAPAVRKAAAGEVWIKFDCKLSPGVTIVSSGTNYTTGAVASLPGYSPNCPGEKSICARQYNPADVMNDPAHAGNKIPRPGVTPLDEVKCKNIQQ